MKIVVIVDGGVVQEVLTSEPAEIRVIDYDIEDTEPDEMMMVDGKNAYVYANTGDTSTTDCSPERVEQIYRDTEPYIFVGDDEEQE